MTTKPIRIPTNKKWNQYNYGDKQDSLWATFNADLTSVDGLYRATRMLSVANSTDTTGLGLAAAFRYFNSQYFAATDGTISKAGSSATGAWALDTASGKPTTLSNRYSDMEIYNDTLRVTVSGNVHYKWSGSAWANFTWTNAQIGQPHMLCAYANRIYQTVDYAKIESANTADTIATVGNSFAIDLGNPTANTITFMRATSSRIWIGTINRQGGKGHIYAWDGNQQSPNEIYRLDSSGALAAVVKDDVLYIMDANGRLQYFNGGTFIELDRLPINVDDYLFFPLGNYNERWIHPNGMTIQDGRIMILINNVYRGATPTYEENVPSGIWEYTKDTGLYHKYSPSRCKAIGGTVTEYGQNRVSRVGALTAIKSQSTSATDNSSLLIGVEVYTDSATTAEIHIGIDDTNDTVQKNAYMVSSRIFSPNIEEEFGNIYTRHSALLSETDRITMKCRFDQLVPTYAAINWYNNRTTFKTSTSLSAYEIGDEVEIVQGAGGGKCAHILSLTSIGGGVTEVTLDDTFAGIDNTMSGVARFQTWKKIGWQTTQRKKWFSSTVGSPDTWVQLKVCTQFTGTNEINDLTLPTVAGQKIV